MGSVLGVGCVMVVGVDVKGGAEGCEDGGFDDGESGEEEGD